MNLHHHNSGGTGATRAVAGTAVSFVAGDFTVAAGYVRIQVQDDAVYVTYDGTTPSSSNGELIAVGGGGYFLRKDLFTMKFVQATTAARVFAQPCNLLAPSSPLLA